LARKLDLPLYSVGPSFSWAELFLGLNFSWAEPGESIGAFPQHCYCGGSTMDPASTPRRIIYACILVVVGTVFFLMIYSGMLDGVGEALFDFAKEIAKFFLG
jgi:hypothetical protein